SSGSHAGLRIWTPSTSRCWSAWSAGLRTTTRAGIRSGPRRGATSCWRTCSRPGWSTGPGATARSRPRPGSPAPPGASPPPAARPSVMTATSPSARAYAEAAVVRTLEDLQTGKRPPLEAGMVVTDVHGGEVLAVVGSRRPAVHGFNRAVEAQRPVGSLLKPFVYLLALASPRDWSLATWVDDSPVTVTLENGRRWSPGNSDGRSHGTVRLIDALARSYNQATVRIGMQVDPRRLADLVRTLAG